MTGLSRGWKTSPLIRRSQSASLAAYVAATYSDSAVDSVTKLCFFED